ncbi:hypothetical protein TW83_09995 [Paracoccus sp. S4493]|uniref:hypothetical protein n=1 Tax=Paracoccus sp. S4493 TaxID=579490 RepID=UPI0005FA8C32|nr:hypothetical protein [Paracoccus sp. S4493]KJZ31244.1 hypothetical protein TW83_09995 [Paracoccus sp. S4493]
MRQIPTGSPVAIPLIANTSDNPKVEYEFKTDIFQSANGTEHRCSRRSRPRMIVKFSGQTATQQHAQRFLDFVDGASSTAVAVPDFMRMGQGVAARGSKVFRMRKSLCAWPPGTLVRIYGMHSHESVVARVLSFDPILSSIQIDTEISEGFLDGEICKIESCVSGAIDGIEMTVKTRAALKFDIEARIYPQEMASQTATVGVFPLKHGAFEPMTVSAFFPSNRLDYGTGPVLDFEGEDKAQSGRRTYSLTTSQMSQEAKEGLVSFFLSCRGRARDFTVPASLIPGDFGASLVRHRFASDILSVEHLTADKCAASIKIVEVLE